MSYYCRIPQAESLRLAAAIFALTGASTWEDARRMLTGPRGTLLLKKEVDPALASFMESAEQSGEPAACQCLSDYRSFLRDCRDNGVPSDLDGLIIPSACYSRWILNQSNALESSDLVRTMFVAGHLIAIEKLYFEITTSEGLDTVIEGWTTIIGSKPFPYLPLAWRLDALNAAVNCHNTRYSKKRDSNDLCAAEALGQEAVAKSPPGWPNLWKYWHNLGVTAFSRYRWERGTAADIDRAIASARTASLLHNGIGLPHIWLGIALHDRYSASGSLTDLDESISLLESVITSPAQNSDVLPTVLNQLGSSLRERYVRHRSVADLDRAISLQQQAVKLTAADDNESMPVRLTNLGNSLIERASLSADLSDITQAVDTLRRAVQISSPDDLQYAARLNNFGNGLKALHEASADIHILSQAIENYGQAVRMSPSHAPELTSRLYNLGNSLYRRWQVQKRSADLNKGSSAYRKACVTGLKRDMQWALFSARNWAEWATSRGCWAEAVEAYGYGLQAIEYLVRTQSSRQMKESWLAELQQFSSEAAYAQYKCRNPRAAVLTLERGRGYLLSEALQLRSLAVERLKTVGRSDLVKLYDTIVTNLTSLEHQPMDKNEGAAIGKQWMEQLRSARQELDRVIREIRKIPGYEGFAAPPELKDILPAARPHPIAYIAAAATGGLALVVRNDPKPTIRVVNLPLLNLQELRRHVTEYQDSYLKRDECPSSWLECLDSTTRWLWDVTMGPVIGGLQGIARVKLVPCGLLGLLPLHAAWKTMPNGERCYAADTMTITYVPNARVVTRIDPESNKLRSQESILIVANPRPTTEQPLRFAMDEAKAAMRTFREGKVLRNRRATLQCVGQLIGRYSTIHIACHARTDPHNPLKSGLILANNEVLTLSDILRSRLTTVRLAVLSACETALPGERLPDEVISIASGFRQAGVLQIIASQWAVLDESTMLLMARFYQLWRIRKLNPAEALSRAQLWMRTTPDRVKAHVVKGFIPASVYKRLRETESGITKFSHPDHWAAFMYVGP
jgi:CHAT domain-containing protein